jgi:hypothetical protein
LDLHSKTVLASGSKFRLAPQVRIFLFPQPISDSCTSLAASLKTHSHATEEQEARSDQRAETAHESKNYDSLAKQAALLSLKE